MHAFGDNQRIKECIILPYQRYSNNVPELSLYFESMFSIKHVGPSGVTGSNSRGFGEPFTCRVLEVR